MKPKYYHLNCPVQQSDNPEECGKVFAEEFNSHRFYCEACDVGFSGSCLVPTYGECTDIPADVFYSCFNAWTEHYDEFAKVI